MRLIKVSVFIDANLIAPKFSNENNRLLTIQNLKHLLFSNFKINSPKIKDFYYLQKIYQLNL